MQELQKWMRGHYVSREALTRPKQIVGPEGPSFSTCFLPQRL